MNIPIFFLGAYVLISPVFMVIFFKLGLFYSENSKNSTKNNVRKHLRKIGHHKQIKEAEEKIKRLNTLERNLDKYDGTGIGQEVIK